MNDKQKLKQLQSRVDIFSILMDNDKYFSPEYLMKMLNLNHLNRNEIRKYKIGKIFND
jgi:hypothetical protein